jgi:hypothetical protein
MNWSRELFDVIERRNKNFNKTLIEYDVNVYVREEYNRETKESTWNTNQWYLHLYDYNNGDPFEVSSPYLLTAEESFAMNFVETDDIDAGLDGFMSLDYLMLHYRDQMSDRVLEYLESFPKYKEDIRPSTAHYI